MSSDAGGFKPLMKLCNQIKWKGETASCSKARYWEDGNSSLNRVWIVILDRFWIK